MKNILFINSVQQQCGVYQFGIRNYKIIQHSTKYNFIYREISNEQQYFQYLETYEPEAVILNYHPLTMEWCNGLNMYVQTVPLLVVHHEGSPPVFGDYYLTPDSIAVDNKYWFSLPRPLFEGVEFEKPSNPIPVISSFGFAFGSKGLGRVVQMVNEQFDEAILRLHLPRAYFGDREGQALAGVKPGCENEMKKEGIKLVFTHDFLTDAQLLKFLSESDLNIFLYDQMEGRGLSSVIDYALSVDVPIAINYSAMFRHVQCPEMNAMGRSLKDIINGGTDHLKQFRELWGNANLIKKYEQILNDTL